MKPPIIKPHKWYSLYDIASQHMFPWCRSYIAVRTIVQLDMQSDNTLKAIITGTGRAKKYHFRGENIINFVKAWEQGKVLPNKK